MAGYALAADLIVVLHFLYVSFTVAGELSILAGGVLRWRWTRNPAFRITHLAAIAIVAAEALAGAACPLTTWEYRLRVRAGQHVEAQLSFVARLVRHIIFYDFPGWVFVVLYVAFAAAVVLTFILLPPAFVHPTRRSAPPGTARPAGRQRPRNAD